MRRAPTARLKEVVAFEPSPEAYRRLVNNLASIDAAVARATQDEGIGRPFPFSPDDKTGLVVGRGG